MNKRIKKKRLAALRSGEYEQAREKLLKIDEKGEHSFCCLGVLCDLHSRENKVNWNLNKGSFLCNVDYGTYLNSSGDLPPSINDWSGVTVDEEDKLVQMNDSGRSFKYIANWISKYL